MTTKQQTYKLGWLTADDRFEIPSLNETMRNLKVISTNASSTNVEGERRDNIHSEWKSFRYPISNDVNVVLVEKGSPKIRSNSKNLENPMKQENTQENESTTPRRRGRPAKINKPLNELGGTSGEFTVQDIVNQNGIKEYEAHNIVRSALKQGAVRVVKEISGGRGKPRKVYRLA
jgi:hypothetical protein